jgi:hypothetical protein
LTGNIQFGAQRYKPAPFSFNYRSQFHMPLRSAPPSTIGRPPGTVKKLKIKGVRPCIVN